MFINEAHFESEKNNEQKLIAKLQKTMRETTDATGLISNECWFREGKEKVEYVFVTKWESKEDFKVWLSREEHVNEHKEMNKQRKTGEPVVPTMKKTLRQYEEVDILSLIL